MRQHAFAALAIFALSYSAYGADFRSKHQMRRRLTIGPDTTQERISIIRPVSLAGRKVVSARSAPQACSISERDMISHPERAVTQ